jgi:hypothetical protein
VSFWSSAWLVELVLNEDAGCYLVVMQGIQNCIIDQIVSISKFIVCMLALYTNFVCVRFFKCFYVVALFILWRIFSVPSRGP